MHNHHHIPDTQGDLLMSSSSRPGSATLGVALHAPRFRTLERLFAPIRRWFERDALLHELNGLDSRVLHDLGINKGDFGAIVDGTFKRPTR
jgi:uncharacterized protein YjiS (DUF1127 family)